MVTNPRNVKLQVRFSKDEYDKITKKASLVGLEVGTFLRLIGLLSEITDKGELKTKD